MPKKKRVSLTSSKILLLLAIILTSIGILFVFEASTAESYNLVGNPYHFLKQQSIWFGVGLVAMLFTYLIPLALWQKLSGLAYIASVVLLILVFIPGIGVELNGAHRWINIGSQLFQPVEVLKLGLVMFFAAWMSKHQRTNPFLLLTLIPTALLLLQPDMGSTLIVLSIAFGMFFLSGGKLSHITVLGLIGVGLIFLLVITQPYRLKRLTTFLNPELDPLGSSFHIRQITIALGNGKWTGLGIGKSKQKYSYIPEASSDSIFAIVAEEIGFVGSIFIMGLYLSYLKAGYNILKKQKPQSFEYLLAAGLLIWISSQIILNLSAVVALVPLTGLPLPFFSYGGSSLVMVLCATAILAKINKTNQ